MRCTSHLEIGKPPKPEPPGKASGPSTALFLARRTFQFQHEARKMLRTHFFIQKIKKVQYCLKDMWYFSKVHSGYYWRYVMDFGHNLDYICQIIPIKEGTVVESTNQEVPFFTAQGHWSTQPNGSKNCWDPRSIRSTRTTSLAGTVLVLRRNKTRFACVWMCTHFDTNTNVSSSLFKYVSVRIYEYWERKGERERERKKSVYSLLAC